jgi:Cu(I)/Ag(I) efflux system protein CusF
MFRTITFAAMMALSSFAAAAAPVMVDGEIRKVDKDAGKLTIKHAELTNLGMPPMTMVFKVQDKAMLAQVTAGDKVRFAADKVGGAITVTALENVK